MTPRSPRRGLASIAAALVLALLSSMASAAPASSEQERPRVVLLTSPCVKGDFLCPPFKQALRRTGVSGRIVSPDVREDFAATLSLLAKQDYALIIVWPGGNFLTWTEGLEKVAPRFPKTRFAILDFPLSVIGGRHRNVQSVLIRPHQASYLAGWLATRMEERRPGRDVVGVVGGVSIQPVNDFIAGFRAGARTASRKTAVLTGYSNDFVDRTKCDAIARRHIARGAGVVFNVAGGCGLGALRAAKRGGVWGIGVDTDQSHLGPHILTSVVKRYDVMMLTLLRQVRDGRVRNAGQTELTLHSNGAGLGQISPEVPASLRAELDGVRRRIVSGEIRVPGVAPR